MVVCAGVIGVILFAGLRPRAYSQGSPEDVLLSVGAMIKDGNAERIGDLFLAKTVEERATLIRLGQLMGTLQDLGQAAQRRFPKDVAVIRAQLAAQSAGRGQSIIDVLARGSPEQSGDALRPPRTPEERQERGDQFQDLTLQLLSDPFGWLQENSGRLGVQRIDDESAVITFDSQPMLGGIAQIRKDGDRWWLILPFQLPGVAQFAPQTRHEWSIIASLIRVIDNALKELTEDIEAGRAATLNDVPRLAGEKGFIPTVIVMGMYAKEMDVRQRRERLMGQFRRRWNQYMDDRAEPADIRRALTETVMKASVEELDKLIRARAADRAGIELPDFPKIQDTELVNLVESWLKARGGTLSLSPSPSLAEIQAASEAIDARAQEGIRSRPTPIR